MESFELFRPGLIHPGRIDTGLIGQLAAMGKTSLIVDADGTLRRPFARKWEPEIKHCLKEALQSGLVQSLWVLSNTILPGMGRDLKREAMSIGANCYCANWWWRKPHPLPFERIIARMGDDPSSIAVIGDQLRTDIRGGNGCGLFTVLTTPIGPDPWWIASRRPWEDEVLACLGLSRT